MRIWKNLLIKQLPDSEIDKAYRLVYEDLCKNHPHVIAAFNGSLHPNDIRPQHYQVNMMIKDIVNRGTGTESKTPGELQAEHMLFLEELRKTMNKNNCNGR